MNDKAQKIRVWLVRDRNTAVGWREMHFYCVTATVSEEPGH